MNQDFLEIPAGRATGCLPRATRPGYVCSLFGEKIPTIDPSQWGDMIGEVELRSFVRKIKDQDGVGSCATESTAQAIEIVRNWESQEWVELNPWFLYHYSSGGRDNGSAIDTNLALARERGIAPESVWPRANGWAQNPSEEAREAAKLYRIDEFYDVSSIAEFGTALLLGMPVVFGWSGHSVVATQLLTTTTFEYANSWAPTWGDQGFGTLRLSAVNWSYGAFAVRTANLTEKPITESRR